MAPAGQTTLGPVLQPAQVQTQKITQSQSFELAKVLLHSSIASVVFERTHTPRRAFQLAKIPNADPDNLYSGFVANTSQAGIGVPQMLRGVSKRVDGLLNLMEGGIFPAIKHRYLSILQFVACHDPSQPSEAVECFTWSFQYPNDQGRGYMTNVVASGAADMKGIHVEHGTLKLKDGMRLSQCTNFNVGVEVKAQINNFSRHSMLSHTLGTPVPPNTDVLQYFFNAYYNGNCPQDYQPGGFGGKPPTALQFHASETHGRYDWGQASANLGYIRTGLTSSVVLPLDGRNYTIPNEEYIDHVTKDEAEKLALEQLNKSLGWRSIQRPDPSHSNPLRRFTPLYQQHRNTSAQSWRPKQTHEDTMASAALQSYVQSNHSTQPSNLIATQTYNIAGSSSSQNFSSHSQNFSSSSQHSTWPRLKIEKLKYFLHGGGKRSEISRGPLAKESVEGKLVRLENSEIDPLRTGRIGSPVNSYYHEKDESLFKEKDNSVSKKKDKSLFKKKAEGKRVVECLCKKPKKESLIRCNICLNWQHLDCLGFSGPNDTRIPDIYVCYQCLFVTGDTALGQLQTITTQRRVLRHILREGYPLGPFHEVAKVFGCGTTDARNITLRFRDSGYLVETAGSKDQPKFKAVEGEAVRQLAERQVFAPMRHIAQFYLYPSDTSAHDRRVANLLNNPSDDDSDEHPLHRASFPISSQPSKREVSCLSSLPGSSTGQSMGWNIDEDEGNVELARPRSGQPPRRAIAGATGNGFSRPKRSFTNVDNGSAEAEPSSKRMRAQLAMFSHERGRTTERASDAERVNMGYGTPNEYMPRGDMAGPFNLDDSSSVTTSNMGH